MHKGNVNKRATPSHKCRSLLWRLKRALFGAIASRRYVTWPFPSLSASPMLERTGPYFFCFTKKWLSSLTVVICFHFTIFVVLETTGRPRKAYRHRLWFAFILLSLSYWKQHPLRGIVAALSCDLLSFYYALSYWKQLSCFNAKQAKCCDLLSFYYLCRTGNNSRSLIRTLQSVVICFHFTIFVVLETTTLFCVVPPSGLWFAFILLSLSYWNNYIQYPEPEYNVVICFHFTIFVVLETTYCGRCLMDATLWFAFILLSLSYWKQLIRNQQRYQHVVICFHFTIFVVLETTEAYPKRCATSLWFAFILLSLSYWKQPASPLPAGEDGCDLLSFYYLCRTGNNSPNREEPPPTVVICFHFTIFVVLETTPWWRCPTSVQLWFAFILLSLSYWKQPVAYGLQLIYSCDLLSFYYLCRTGNNTRRRNAVLHHVVICFHFTIFVVLETTHRRHFSRAHSLWFAFILLSLSYWKQLTAWHASSVLCCDLLSFYYLCRTGNNSANPANSSSSVVICFHFTIFVVLETTR